MSSVTVLRSGSGRVEIGADRPFCIIGERINPTGRKAFQAELRAGDLSRVEADVAAACMAQASALSAVLGHRAGGTTPAARAQALREGAA